MTIRIRLFASLREQVPDAAPEIDGAGVTTVNEAWLAATDNLSMPEHVLCSVNLEHRDRTDPVSDGDEVAFFPPVTGG